MKRNLCIIALLSAALSQSATAQSFELEQSIGYPDFKFMPPASDYHGPVFVLSDNFPKAVPPIDAAVQNILSIDFEENPMEYVMAVRDYAFAGNIRGDGDVSADFVLQNNTVGNQWYHVPWQHWGAEGREGYHGLTREGPLLPKMLAPTQTNQSSAYAVGFYNGQGGFTIGQTWPSPDKGPDLSGLIAGETFPEGTVVAKFLFTVLDGSQVPYLNNPLQWNAYMYNCDVPSYGKICKGLTGDEPHSTQMVNLLQMDIMVKDSRATEAAGWVFGTFVYNGTMGDNNPYSAACSDFTGESRNWCNLVPVGLMWGNDPDNAQVEFNATPTETIINTDLKQTWINPDDTTLPPMHLGFNSRLNGPADNPTSSCMSCHSTAQYPSISAIMPWLNKPIVPKPTGAVADAAWMKWFRNFEDGEAFDEGHAFTLDFSLQLTKSIENYVKYRSAVQGGQYAVEYWSNGDKISRGAE